MMTAEEARKLTFEAKDEFIKDAIDTLEEKVKFNAKKGIPYADIDIYNKIPFIMTITDSLIQHFENLGYAVTVSDLDTTVKITVSWLDV